MVVQLMSQRAYARHRGVTLAAVQKAIKSTRISTINGKIDPAVADIQWARNTNATQQERGALAQFEVTQAALAEMAGGDEAAAGGVEVSPTPTRAPENNLALQKADTEAIRRQLLEMELAKKRGELVEVEAMRRAWGEKLRAARELFDSLADRLSPVIAAETDVKKVDAMLRNEIRQAMFLVSQVAPEKVA